MDQPKLIELKVLLAVMNEDDEKAKELIKQMSNSELEFLRACALRMKNIIYDYLVDTGHFIKWY